LFQSAASSSGYALSSRFRVNRRPLGSCPLRTRSASYAVSQCLEHCSFPDKDRAREDHHFPGERLKCVTPASQSSFGLCKYLTRMVCGSRTCKPNSVRRIAPVGRSFLWATHYCGAQATYPEVVTHRAGTSRSRSLRLPPYLVLLRVGFALPGALLRQRCALTAPFHPYLGVAAGAVCFLWHFPSTGLETGLPDVIRHTALRSSDFPPALRRATVRSSCQHTHYSGRRASDPGRHEKSGHGFHGFTRIRPSFFFLNLCRSVKSVA